MNTRRTAKISQALLETISSTILHGIKDPRVKNVTVLGVEVSPDIRTAKVSVSVMGSEKEQALCMHGLRSASGFLQSKIADRIQTRYTPILTFKLDSGLKKSNEAAQILREVLPPSDDEDLNDNDEESSTSPELSDEDQPDDEDQLIEQ